jgi:hypothetical protein
MISFLLKTKVGYSIKGEFVNVNIQCKLNNEILQIFRNFVLFELQIPEDYQPPLQRESNAFKILVSNSTQLALPSLNYQQSQTKKIYCVMI